VGATLTVHASELGPLSEPTWCIVQRLSDGAIVRIAADRQSATSVQCILGVDILAEPAELRVELAAYDRETSQVSAMEASLTGLAESSVGDALVRVLHRRVVASVTPAIADKLGGTLLSVTGFGFTAEPGLRCVFRATGAHGASAAEPSTAAATYMSSTLIQCVAPSFRGSLA